MEYEREMGRQIPSSLFFIHSPLLNPGLTSIELDGNLLICWQGIDVAGV